MNVEEMMRVRGPINKKTAARSASRLAALEAGDIGSLLTINRAEFGGRRMMADDDGGDDGGDGGGDDSGDDDGGDGGDDGGDGGDSGSDDAEDLKRRLAETEKRMKAADKRADAAEKKIKDQEDAKKDELTKATDELTEAQETISELQTTITALRLENAFVTSNSHTWHEPETALSLAQSGGYLDGVVDEESGEVDKKALKKALDNLAKDKKFLVKSKSKGDDDGGDGPSGEPSGGRSKNKDDKDARRKKLARRMPALDR